MPKQLDALQAWAENLPWAAILLAAVYLQAVFALPSHNAPHYEGHQTAAYQNEHGGAARPASNKFAERIPEGSAASRQDGKPQEGGLWGWIVAFHDELIAIGTLVLGLFAALQWKDSRKSNERQLRAYVTIKSASVSNNGVGEIPEVGITFRNSGQTPAYNFTNRSAMGVDYFPFRNGPFSIGSGDELPKQPLGPGEEIGMQPKFHLALQSHHIAAFASATMAVYVIGEASYQDVFGKKQTLKYCLFSNSHTDSARGNMAAYHEGNSLS